MTESFDLASLMAAARDRSPEGRSRLFALLGQLFLARGAALNARERRGFAELLEILKPVAHVEARLELAYATAESAFAPSELAQLLAEDEIEIAALVLFKSEALGAAELLALAEDPERARIIAGRRALPMLVADALMRRSDTEIARTLLKNDGTKLSIPALSDAIELAREDSDLQHRLADRAELLEEMAIEMLEWAEPAVRDQLTERFELGDGEPAGVPPGRALPGGDLVARLKALTSLGLESGPPHEPDFASVAAREPAPEMPPPDPRFRLSPRLMIETLRRGALAQAEAMFAKMADLPMPVVRRFARESNGEHIAVAARAIGMAREEFATIYLLWKKAQSKDGLVAAGDLGTALDLFDTIPQDRIEMEIAGWRELQAESA